MKAFTTGRGNGNKLVELFKEISVFIDFKVFCCVE